MRGQPDLDGGVLRLPIGIEVEGIQSEDLFVLLSEIVSRFHLGPAGGGEGDEQYNQALEATIHAWRLPEEVGYLGLHVAWPFPEFREGHPKML